MERIKKGKIIIFILFFIVIVLSTSVLAKSPLEDIMDDSPGKITEQYKRVKEIDATKVKKLSNTELNERIQDAQDVMKYCRENPNRTIVGIGNTNDINAEVYRIYNDILGPETVSYTHLDVYKRQREDYQGYYISNGTYTRRNWYRFSNKSSF